MVLCSFSWSPVVSIFSFSLLHFADHVFYLEAEPSHFPSALVHWNWCWPFTTVRCWGPGLPGCHVVHSPESPGTECLRHLKCGNKMLGAEKSVHVETGAKPLLTFVFILRNSEHSTCRLKPRFYSWANIFLYLVSLLHPTDNIKYSPKISLKICFQPHKGIET